MNYSTQISWRNGFAVLKVIQDPGVSLSWEELQAIKNEQLDPEILCIEIYPPSYRVCNEANIRWLWIVPEDLEERLPNLLD